MIGLRDIAEAFGITAAIASYLMFAAVLWSRLQIQRLPDHDGDT